MSTAPTPEREIRLTENGPELRNLRAEAERWRQQAALEYTRAESADRRALKAEQRAADWEAIALHNAHDACNARIERAMAEQRAAAHERNTEGAHAAWAAEVAEDCAELGRLTVERDRMHDLMRDAICALQGVLDSIEYRARYNAELRESVGNVLAEYPHLTERCGYCGGYDADYPDRVCESCFGGNVLREVVR